MKLFYKKDYEKAVEALNKANKQLSQLEKNNKSLESYNTQLKLELNNLQTELQTNYYYKEHQQEQIKKLEEDLSHTNDLFDSALKENDEYSKKVEEYEKIIADLKSDRYLLTKVRPGRTANTNKMGLKKSVASKSLVNNYMKQVANELQDDTD